MSERMIPGAVINSPDADLTGSPDRRVNLLHRFMDMDTHMDLGQEEMTVEKAKNMLIGGLVMNLEDLDGYPKLDGLIEESVDRQQLYRKITEEPEPTPRMLFGIGVPNQAAYRAEIDKLRQGLEPVNEAERTVRRDPGTYTRRYR